MRVELDINDYECDYLCTQIVDVTGLHCIAVWLINQAITWRRDMLNQLHDLFQHCHGPQARLCSVGAGWAPDLPADALFEAQRCCRAALEMPQCIHPTPSQQGALALFRWVADLPDDIRDGIEPLPFFRDDIERAWQEPFADTYVSLCNTVQDVWAHAFGPEANVDDRLLADIQSAEPATVLDFGAGAGHFSIALALGGAEVDAVEVDAVKASFLAFRGQLAGVGSLVHVGLRRSTYDAVLAIDVLDHLEDPAGVLKTLLSRVAPAGRLLTLAQFPNDGWHQCDPAKVTACSDLLWDAFELGASRVFQNHPPVPWLDVFQRRAPSVDRMDCPLLHPRAGFRVDEASGQFVLAASAFYSGACLVDANTRSVIERFDGRRSIDELTRLTGFDNAEIAELCSQLCGQRLLQWKARADKVAHAA